MNRSTVHRILADPEVLRLAIVRNPVTRLVSTWKSKLACWVDFYGTDWNDAVEIVPRLMRAAGLPIAAAGEHGKTCLRFDVFVQVLRKIRARLGALEMERVDHHLMSQSEACGIGRFKYNITVPVENMLRAPELQLLYQRFGVDSSMYPLGHAHQSTGKKITPHAHTLQNWTRRDAKLLATIEFLYATDVRALNALYNKASYNLAQRGMLSVVPSPRAPVFPQFPTN